MVAVKGFSIKRFVAYFVILAVFGYAINGSSPIKSILAGLVFAVLMTIFDHFLWGRSKDKIQKDVLRMEADEKELKSRSSRE